MSMWTEMAQERRADRVTAAEQARKDREAAAKLRQKQRDTARDRRAKAREALTGWLRSHTMDLLFVPVIVVPAVLAWTAMAEYGREVFGPVGTLLPLFSEGAMWTFAFAVPMAQRARRRTGWLHLGTWVFAAVAAVLNYVHGSTVAHGVVMALVSVGGVVVHQLVTAAPGKPRATRAERDAARLARLEARRVVAVRRAALRDAVAELAADGTATLVHRPGKMGLRRRFGRARLVPVTVPGLPVAPDPDALAEDLAAEVAEYLTSLPTPPTAARRVIGGNGRNTSGTAETAPVEPVPAAIARRVPGLLAKARAAIDAGRLPARPTRGEVQKFLRVRAEVAVVVTNALNTDPGDDTRQAVTA